jgi:16S rRNA (uracil1498-N3)-methyltransferase
VNPRFYAPGAQSGGVTALPEEEGRHLTRVLRLKEGATIRVFDGRGHEFDAVVEKARVEKAGKSDVLVAVGAVRPASAAEPRVAITLAQAVLKGDKMDDVVRDAVMMGVAAIQPIVTARTEISMATLQRGNRRERWQRIAVSSAKQCGRAVVPDLREPIAFDAIPAALTALTLPDPGFMFIEPTASGDSIALADIAATPPREATVIIGPEGGWTPEEISRGSSACTLVTLRSPTLRADAMALVAVAALLAGWKEL